MKYTSFLPDTNEVLDELVKLAEDKTFKVIDEGSPSNPKNMKDLYNVSQDDKTGEELIEKAHPEKDSVTVIPSYTLNGGLVENQTQQQEKDIAVALKDPDCRLYSNMAIATKELTDELLIVAEEMDVRGESDLAAYADNIMERINKKAAVGPLTVPLAIAGTVAAVIGGYYYLAHETDPINYGVDKNLQGLLTFINEYNTKNPERAQELSMIFQHLDTMLSGVDKTRRNFTKAMDTLGSRLKSATKISIPSKEQLQTMKSDSIAQVASNEDANTIVNKINQFSSAYNDYIKQVIPELDKIKRHLINYFKITQDIAQSEDGSRSTLKQIWESGKKYLGKITKSDSDIIVEALTVFIKSLADDLTIRISGKDRLVDMLTSKVQFDISEQFSLDQPASAK